MFFFSSTCKRVCEIQTMRAEIIVITRTNSVILILLLVHTLRQDDGILCGMMSFWKNLLMKENIIETCNNDGIIAMHKLD